MASRDLTQAFIDRRNTAIRKRTKDPGSGGGTSEYNFCGSHASSPSFLLRVSFCGVLSLVSHCGTVCISLSLSLAAHHLHTGRDSAFKKLTAGHDHELMLAEEGHNGAGGGGGSIQMANLGNGVSSNKGPPGWVKHVDAVEHSLHTIQSQMSDLQSLHSQRVGSVFGKDLPNMEGRIDKLTQQITDEFRVAERHLQAVGKVAAAAVTAEEATVGANVQRSLAKRLQELSVNFRQSQRKYLAEVQAQKTGKVPEPYLGLLDGGGSSSSGTGAMGGGGGSGADGGGGEFFTTQQMAVVDDLTQAVQSRDAEIVQIAKSIEELSTIFKELAVLVIDQGVRTCVGRCFVLW